MRCEFCGAQIKEGSNVCEYCGSAVERTAPKTHTIIKDSKKPHGNIVKVICKSIIILVCICAVFLIVSLVVVLNSDMVKEYSAYSIDSDITYSLPGNKTKLTGKIVSCDSSGMASIEYEDIVYENVKILDNALITWVNDTDRTLDTVGICFSTDENGDINTLGLLSAGFFVMGKDDDRYIAVRGEDLISFTSEIPIETECYYGGYFSYPDMRLYAAEEESPFSMSYMDPKCDDKTSIPMQEYYTGEEIILYAIHAEGIWFFCSKETYDAVEIGDLLNRYQLCDGKTNLSFIVGNTDVLNKADADTDEIPMAAKESEEPTDWRDAYQMFLNDWKRIEEYGDFSYLPFYFGNKYYFDKYFLCDVDENGIPELFLYSTNMRLTAVFTYEDEPVFLTYDMIYGINPETDEVIINGHWHGSGGSGADEWSAYHISGIACEYSMYIDFFEVYDREGVVQYTIYDPEKDEYTHPQDCTEYDALYAGHVEPCVLAEDYLLYDLSDISGFDDIQ